MTGLATPDTAGIQCGGNSLKAGLPASVAVRNLQGGNRNMAESVKFLHS
jgi:hypothetical protein